MTIKEIIKMMSAGEVAGWALILLLLFLSLIQISPLKLNPWDNVFAWLGRKLNGSMEYKIEHLQKQVLELWINAHRQTILTFARECRGNVEHSAEEWSTLLNLCEEYERYCNTHNVNNGVVRENTRYLRQLFQELSREHKI